MFKGFSPPQGALGLSTGLTSAAFPLLAPNGTAAAPSYALDADTGMYLAVAGLLGFSVDGAPFLGIDGASAVRLRSSVLLGWSSAADITSASDVILRRTATAVLSLQDADVAQEFRVWGATTGSVYLKLGHGASDATIQSSTGNIYIGSSGSNQFIITTAGLLGASDNAYNLGSVTGNRMQSGFFGTSVLCAPGSGATAGPVTVTELLTVAAAATTDSTLEIPAGALILSCAVRVTTVIPTAATFTVTTATGGTTLGTAAVSTAANSTDKGTAAGAFYQSAATKVRITPNAQPADNTGRIRLSVTYWVSTPATS